MDGLQIQWEVSYVVLSVTLALIAYITYLRFFNRAPQNLPPGPRGWRAIVDILKAFHNENLHELASVWVKKYGPITYVNMLGQPTVILNTADLSRRIVASDKTKLVVADRVPCAATKLACYNGKDLLFSPYDDITKKKRRMFHSVIGLYGDGIEKFEQVVSEEMNRFFFSLKEFENQDINLSKHISRSLKVIIYILILPSRDGPLPLSRPSHRLPPKLLLYSLFDFCSSLGDVRDVTSGADVSKILVRPSNNAPVCNLRTNLFIYNSVTLGPKDALKALGELPDDISKPDILEEYDLAFNKLCGPDLDFVINNIPIVARFPGRYKNAVKRLRDARIAAEELLYYAPKRSWKPGQPRGIADLLFDLQDKPGNEWMRDDPEHVIAFLMSLFLAAHLTSRATVNGAFLCLLNNPKMIKKVQDEIDNVLGDRRPRVEDRSSMPFTESTILETLRLITQIPLTGFRMSSEDIHIDGLVIPKNTMVLMNNWFFHHNEEIYEDPWSFKPERFLDSKGQLLSTDDPIRKNLLPFGLGTRSCPGEVFARSRTFMFITSILQKYDLLPPENDKLVPADFRTNNDEVKGLARQSPPYKCRLRERQKRN